MADNMVHSWTSVTTGTIAVTADTNTDVSFTQPADTIIRNLICIDRKSTRLNSSHGYISYAVFCLKKKKNNTKAT